MSANTRTPSVARGVKRSLVRVCLGASLLVSCAGAAHAQSALRFGADLRPGRQEPLLPDSFAPCEGVVRGGRLHLAADLGVEGLDLWSTNGTRGGTESLGDWPRGAGVPRLLGETGEKVVFLFGRDLWSAGSGIEGAQVVAARLTDTVTMSESAAVRVGGELFVAGTRGTQSVFVVSDGSISGTRVVPAGRALSSGGLGAAGGRIVFGSLAFNGVGPALLSADSQGASRVLVDSGFESARAARVMQTGNLCVALLGERTGDGLWLTDGTNEGTTRVASLPSMRRGEWNATSSRLTLVTSSGQLWLSDLTGPGTQPASWPGRVAASGGANSDASGRIRRSIRPFGNGLAIVGSLGGATSLFMGDGTAAGTHAATAPGLSPIGIDAEVIGADGVRRCVFVATVAGATRFATCGLWSTSGAQTLELPVRRGFDEQSFQPLGMLDGRLVFAASPPGEFFSWAIWITDGTHAGTTLLRSVGPDAPADSNPGAFAEYDGGIACLATRPDGVLQRWLLPDGGGRPVACQQPETTTLAPYGQQCARVNAKYYVLSEAATNGVREASRLFASNSPATLGEELAVNATLPFDFAGTAVFLAPSDPTDLGSPLAIWRTDGSRAGTRVIVHPAFLPQQVSSLRNVVGQLVITGSGPAGSGVWASDGTDTGTRQVMAIPPGCNLSSDESPLGPVVPAGPHWFAAIQGPGIESLMPRIIVSDGTPESTRSLPGTVRPLAIAPLNGRLAIIDLREGSASALWITRDDASGSLPLTTGASTDLYGGSPVCDGNRLFFTASDPEHGTELWTSDGTQPGTHLVADVWPGPAGSFPSGLVVHQGEVFFSATSGPLGTELWRSDGTAAGTRMVADINPGRGSSCPGALTVLEHHLCFSAFTPETGREPWILRLAPCSADFNADGELNADDLGDFISCYFAAPACPLADFNASGAIDEDDLGDFITAYFGGCS